METQAAAPIVFRLKRKRLEEPIENLILGEEFLHESKSQVHKIIKHQS
jgi:hypothetical protein